jgi:hypothetical protein
MTLIELLAVMGANSILVGAAVVALVAVERADRTFDARIDHRHALLEMVQRVRQDIRGSDQVRWDEAKQTLRMNMADETIIIYATFEGRCERRVLDALAFEEGAAGELTGAFRVPAILHASVKPADAKAAETVRITWASASDEHWEKTSPPPVEILVLVGRDERLLHK